MILKTEGDKHVVVTRHFAASPEAVYRAHTEPRLIQKWMLGLMGLLVAMAVGGGVVMYGKVMALEAKVDAMQIQVANIQKLLEPRFRGAVHEYDYGIYHASPSLR